MLWPAGGAQRPRRGRGAQRASSPQSQRRTRPRPLRVGARGLPRHRPAGPGCGAGDRGSLAHPPGPPGGAFRNRPGRGLGGVVLPDPGGADARRGGAALLAPGRRGVRGRGGRIMTTVKIRIPPPLRGYTTGRSEVEVAATTVGEALAALGAAHEGLLARILTPEGTQRQFVNLFVGERNVRELAGLATPLTTGDVIAIIPAVAGGAPCARGAASWNSRWKRRCRTSSGPSSPCAPVACAPSSPPRNCSAWATGTCAPGSAASPAGRPRGCLWNSPK